MPERKPIKKYRRASDITVAVIGYGGAFNMGALHLNEMQSRGMQPVAVCDSDAARLKTATEDFPGIGVYTRLNTMLNKSKPEVVTIITPHNTHARLALQCLNAGCHVITEKPFAITTDECDAMITAAQRKGLMLSTYHNRHWDGCVLEAVHQIHNRNAVGDVYRIDISDGGYGAPGAWWRSSKSISGGISYDWGVHYLEYALQIIRDDIVEVTGFAKTGFWAPKTIWKQDTNEDEVNFSVRFKNQKWITFSMSHLEANPKPGFMEIHGTRGSYIMDHDWYETVQIKSGRTVRTRGQNRVGDWTAFYNNILDHLTKRKALVISPEWARRPIQILDLANKSARSGRALRAKYA